MQTPRAEAPSKPVLCIQMDIFSGYEATPVQVVRAVKKEKTALQSDIRGKERVPAPKATPLVKNALKRKQDDSDDHEDDDTPTVDLEVIEVNDNPEMILAKRMFLRMMWDLSGDVEEAEPDMFGQTSIQSHKTSLAEQCRLDALIWLFSLNPDGGLVTIEWVCEVLGFDVHRVRRITGRSMRNDLKRVVQLLSTMISQAHAQVCEDIISDYCNISSWKHH